MKDGKPYLAIGTPGGDNQDQQILNVLLRVLAFNQPLQAAIEAPASTPIIFTAPSASRRTNRACWKSRIACPPTCAPP